MSHRKTKLIQVTNILIEKNRLMEQGVVTTTTTKSRFDHCLCIDQSSSRRNCILPTTTIASESKQGSSPVLSWRFIVDDSSCHAHLLLDGTNGRRRRYHCLWNGDRQTRYASGHSFRAAPNGRRILSANWSSRSGWIAGRMHLVCVSL